VDWFETADLELLCCCLFMNTAVRQVLKVKRCPIQWTLGQHLGLDLYEFGLSRKRQEGGAGEDGWWVAEKHGGLVAGIAAGAVPAILLYFVANREAVGDVKVEVLEEGGYAGEEAETRDVLFAGLSKEGLDQKTAGAVAFDVGTDDDGADLSEMWAVDMKSGAAQEVAGVRFDDGEGGDALADLKVGATEKGAVVGEAFNESVDGRGIVELSRARVHGGHCGEGGGYRVVLYERQ
jgi:hypothetical protein